MNVPVLIMHGTEDKVIDCTHGRKLSTMVNEKLLINYFIENAGHNNIETTYFLEYKEILEKFKFKLLNHDYNKKYPKKSSGFSADNSYN